MQEPKATSDDIDRAYCAFVQRLIDDLRLNRGDLLRTVRAALAERPEIHRPDGSDGRRQR